MSVILTKPRYWFHVTDKKDWGNEKTLRPRTPCSVATDENCEPLEPLTPRICVAPTISGCLSAIWYCGNESIYVTAKKVKAVKAKAPDARVTGEHWILEPCKFVAYRDISSKVAKHLPYSGTCGSDLKSDLKEQSERRKKIRKALIDGGFPKSIA